MMICMLNYDDYIYNDYIILYTHHEALQTVMIMMIAGDPAPRSSCEEIRSEDWQWQRDFKDCTDCRVGLFFFWRICAKLQVVSMLLMVDECSMAIGYMILLVNCWSMVTGWLTIMVHRQERGLRKNDSHGQSCWSSHQLRLEMNYGSSTNDP